MDKEKMIETISKGEALTDSKELLGWVNQSEENQNTYIRYKNLWAILQSGKEMDSKSIAEGLRNVKSKINRSNKRYSFRNVFKYAAIIVVALFGGFMLNILRFDTNISMNEISVPKGNRSSIVLSDGTKVWISNNSKLTYPENFKGKRREVKLEGEAFFNVTHNPKKPFIVNVGENRIKVLGTEFFVTAYPYDETIQTDLVSGRIQFDVNTGIGTNNYKSFTIKPSYSLVYNKSTRKLHEEKIPDGFYNYWLKGVYKFKDEKFESLAKKIKRIYGVEIIFEVEVLKNTLFTGTFNIDDNIYTLMEVFKRASGRPIDYRRERDKIYIKLNY